MSPAGLWTLVHPLNSLSVRPLIFRTFLTKLRASEPQFSIHMLPLQHWFLTFQHLIADIELASPTNQSTRNTKRRKIYFSGLQGSPREPQWLKYILNYRSGSCRSLNFNFPILWVLLRIFLSEKSVKSLKKQSSRVSVSHSLLSCLFSALPVSLLFPAIEESGFPGVPLCLAEPQATQDLV